MSTPWTKDRIRDVIARQIPFHYQHAWQPDGSSLWFGRWNKPYHHWVRAHVETLALLSVYLDGNDDPKILADVNTGLLSACRAHRTDGSLTLAHTTGPWGCGWQSAWWAYRLVRCVQRLGDRLPAATVAAVRRVVECECDRFIGVRPPAGVKYDTKMEENSWDAPVMAWASFVFADHPHAPQWELEARRWAYNSLTRFKDKFDHRLIDGRPAAAWYTGPTLHPDFTSENHGTFHPNYQACVVHHCITAMAYVAHGRPVPETVLHNVAEVAETLRYFLAPDCTQLMVTGNDWATFHGMNSMTALLGHFLGGPWVALGQANLDKYAWLLSVSDNGHLYGSTVALNHDQQAFFFHTGNSTTLAEVYDVLPLREGGGAAPTGSRYLEYVEVLCQRDDKRLAGVAWRTLYGSPLLTVLPLSDTSLASWAPWTGIGRLRLRGREGHLKPKVLTHDDTIDGDTIRATGVLEYLDDQGSPLIRQTLHVEAAMGGPVVYREELTAVQAVDLEVNHGWCIAIANDLHNGYQRRVNGEVVKYGSPTDQAVGRRVTVDDRIAYDADADLHYVSPGQRLREDNRFQCTMFDRILAAGRAGQFAAGETIRKGQLTVTVL